MAGGPLRSMLILILLTTVRMPLDYALLFQEPQTKSGNLRTKDRFPENYENIRQLIHPTAFSWESKIHQSSAVCAEIQLAQLQKTLLGTYHNNRLPLLSTPGSLRRILPIYPAVLGTEPPRPQYALVPTSTAN